MLILDQKKLEIHLKKKLKIEKNAIVWVHLGTRGLGLIKNLNIITKAFENVLRVGVLIIPAFTYSWARKKNFKKDSEVDKNVGIYPNHLIKKKNFLEQITQIFLCLF